MHLIHGNRRGLNVVQVEEGPFHYDEIVKEYGF